jgi:hypothetical protein
MRHVEIPTWVRAGQIKRTARLIGLDRLQQYLDDLIGTRAYGWFEARVLTVDEQSQLAALVDEENPDHGRFPTGLAYRKVEPPWGLSNNGTTSGDSELKTAGFVGGHQDRL